MPDLPIWQGFAARANEAALYTLLILQPLLGLCASILHGDRIRVLGDITVPSFLLVDRKLSHLLFGLHGTVALVLLGSIGMHVAAALFHHLVRKDDVLATMCPACDGQVGRDGTPRLRASIFDDMALPGPVDAT